MSLTLLCPKKSTGICWGTYVSPFPFSCQEGCQWQTQEAKNGSSGQFFFDLSHIFALFRECLWKLLEIKGFWIFHKLQNPFPACPWAHFFETCHLFSHCLCFMWSFPCNHWTPPPPPSYSPCPIKSPPPRPQTDVQIPSLRPNMGHKGRFSGGGGLGARAINKGKRPHFFCTIFLLTLGPKVCWCLGLWRDLFLGSGTLESVSAPLPVLPPSVPKALNGINFRGALDQVAGNVSRKIIPQINLLKNSQMWLVFLHFKRDQNLNLWMQFEPKYKRCKHAQKDKKQIDPFQLQCSLRN